MANDIDLWQDIEQLEEMGKKSEARDLTLIFNARYICYNEKEVNELVKKFEEKYGYIPL